MKVYSYLEYMGLGYLEQNEAIAYITEFSVIGFYSQPFKPKLITELFEGWEYTFYDCDQNLKYNKLGLSLYFSATMPKTMIFINENDDTDELDWYFPRTLDDFINDCQRAGIELKWKEKE